MEAIIDIMKKLWIVLFLCSVFFGNEKIRIQLNWKPQFEFAGFYMAKELGYYGVITEFLSNKKYKNDRYKVIEPTKHGYDFYAG